MGYVHCINDAVLICGNKSFYNTNYMSEGGFYFKEQQRIQIFCGTSPATEANCQELLSFPEDFIGWKLRLQFSSKPNFVQYEQIKCKGEFLVTLMKVTISNI